MEEEACGEALLAQMCAVAVGQAHICNRLNVLGEFLSLALCVSVYTVPLNPQLWTMSCLTASLSVLPLIPPRPSVS